jgi:hypothetical protein
MDLEAGRSNNTPEELAGAMVAEMRKNPSDCDLFSKYSEYIYLLSHLPGVSIALEGLMLQYMSNLQEIHFPVCPAMQTHTKKNNLTPTRAQSSIV